MNTQLIYENPLAREEDIKDWILEGSAQISFPGDCMYMENAVDPSAGQKANYVLWCPEVFSENIRIEWEFRPVREPGLAMMFFAAQGRNGENLFDPQLQKRTGEYIQYHHGDINAFHVSYFRRKEPDERAFHTCNLRKSYGFYLVCQGADPIPDASEDAQWYQIAVEKKAEQVAFSVNGLEVFRFVDDGVTYGELLGKGCLGFRQLAPMAAEYRRLRVYEING
ncbi:MAG: DUF1961 family protein [Lachnospiraceae bacterium]|nr:DUF1961 family protein [Lachnospiraceae bacterium]